jgi:hypothetical protein
MNDSYQKAALAGRWCALGRAAPVVLPTTAEAHSRALFFGTQIDPEGATIGVRVTDKDPKTGQFIADLHRVGYNVVTVGPDRRIGFRLRDAAIVRQHSRTFDPSVGKWYSA